MRLLCVLRRLSNACSSLYPRNNNVFGHVLGRTYAADLKIKWVRPSRIPSYDATQSGDLTPFQMPKDEDISEIFSSCDLIHKTTNENVKRVFSLSNQSRQQKYYFYKMSLVNKVKSHEYDKSSLEVRIAVLTARIRIMQYLMPIQKKGRKYRRLLNLAIHKRRRLLKNLRTLDYKKFEWLLEQLDLKYYPVPIKKEKVTRKKSTKLLAELKREKLKEFKLGEYKKKLDQQKIPFLEKKLEMLKYIKEQESSFQLERTITDSDIENCIKQIENVKIQVKENQKRGYVRKVHPYTLEAYNPKIFEKSNKN